MAETAAPSPHRGPEAPDVASRSILLIAAGLAAFVAGTLLVLGLFYAATVRQPTRKPPTLFPTPRLETRENGAERRRLHEAARRMLTSYGWVDREHGVIRIPIDRAKAAIIARGSAGYDPLTPAGPP